MNPCGKEEGKNTLPFLEISLPSMDDRMIEKYAKQVTEAVEEDEKLTELTFPPFPLREFTKKKPLLLEVLQLTTTVVKKRKSREV